MIHQNLGQCNLGVVTLSHAILSWIASTAPSILTALRPRGAFKLVWTFTTISSHAIHLFCLKTSSVFIFCGLLIAAFAASSLLHEIGLSVVALAPASSQHMAPVTFKGYATSVVPDSHSSRARHVKTSSSKTLSKPSESTIWNRPRQWPTSSPEKDLTKTVISLHGRPSISRIMMPAPVPGARLPNNNQATRRDQRTTRVRDGRASKKPKLVHPLRAELNGRFLRTLRTRTSCCPIQALISSTRCANHIPLRSRQQRDRSLECDVRTADL